MYSYFTVEIVVVEHERIERAELHPADAEFFGCVAAAAANDVTGEW